MRTVSRRDRLLCATVLSLVALSACPHTQTATEQELKAALLYNFAKFVAWPSDAMPPGAPLILCVLGDDVVADAIDEATKGRTIDGHEMTLRRVKSDGSFRACHVLYLSGMDAKHSTEILAGLRNATVLTASDLDRFAELGGVTNFFVERGKMHFAVNIDSAQRARLLVSSRMLSLAKIVKDEPHGQR